MNKPISWFTSDLHLGHKAVIGFCSRPFQDVQEMNAKLIANYCAKVKPWDYVYFLGDICFEKPSVGIAYLRELPGTKILVLGNHDKWSLTQYREAGFSAVIQEAKIRLQGNYFILSHYPYAPSPKQQQTMDPHDLRYLDYRPTDKGSFLLCGHVHEKWKTQGRMINVGVDQWDYAPVSENQIMKLVGQSIGSSGTVTSGEWVEKPKGITSTGLL